MRPSLASDHVNNASSQLVDNEKWKELVADIEKIVAKRRDGEFPDEEDRRSDWHTLGRQYLDPHHLNTAPMN
jgi:hypothetical protein